MTEIIWNVYDDKDNELKIPHLDYGSPPHAGDTVNFWIDGPESDDIEAIRGQVIYVEHDIRLMTRGNLKAVRYVVIHIKPA